MSVTLTFGEVEIEALSDRVTLSFPLTLLERQSADRANVATRRLVEMIREAYASGTPDHQERDPSELAEISSLIAETARASQEQ